jgi:hypothetical protein
METTPQQQDSTSYIKEYTPAAQHPAKKALKDLNKEQKKMEPRAGIEPTTSSFPECQSRNYTRLSLYH